MTLKKSAGVALALLLTLAMVGCGAKKDDSASTEAAGDAEKQSQDNGDGSTTTTTTKSGGSTSTTSGSGSLDSLDDLTNGELGDCLGTSFAFAALVLAPLGFTGGASEEQIDKFEQDTEELAAKIPSELKGDFEKVAEAYKEYGEILKGVDFSDMTNPDVLEKLDQAGDTLDASEVKAAQDNIQAYFDSNCGK